MEAEKNYSLSEAHLHFAKTINGEVWGLLEKTDRSKDEDEQMIAAAFASYYHWLSAGTIVNRQRGEYMIAKSYLATGNFVEALTHATHCLELTDEYPQEMADFDLAFAYELFARVNSACDNREIAAEYQEKAAAAGEMIKDQEDRTIFFQDYSGGNWYNE